MNLKYNIIMSDKKRTKEDLDRIAKLLNELYRLERIDFQND